MISRLILVGVVGVLGVSLPDGTEWDRPLTRARTAATARPDHRAAIAFEPIPADDSPVNRIADELNRRSEGVDIPATPIAKVATVSPPAQAESDKAVERLFAENQVWGGPTTEAVAKSDQAVDKLFAVNDVWGETIAPSVALASAPRPAFEPIAAVDGASSLADELNRRSEGLSTAEDAEQPSLQTALSLTRDAALAWMNVLTKTVAAPGHSR